jgi:thymidylate kinase
MTGNPQPAPVRLSGELLSPGFIAAAFNAWRGAGIPFVVLRNYESLPASTTNDIDVLVSPKDLREAEAVLCRAAENSGFRLHNRGEFATLALYFSARDSAAQVHFDLFTALKWRGFDFLDCRDFLEMRIRRGPFNVPHPAHEAATNLTAFLIFAGKVKEKYWQSVREGFAAHPEVATKLLGRTYGAAQASFLVESGIQQRWSDIEAQTPALRRTLALRQVTLHPLRTAGSLLSDCLRLVKRLVHPPGVAVVLFGPDGCGKSTAAGSVIEGLKPTFPPEKGAHFHWKPPLFSARRRAARSPTTNPHAQPPRSRALSLVFFAFHWLEFFLGFYLCTLPRLFRGGMVLIDRYYYDFLVDQRRYRLRVPQKLVRLGYALVPKPDLAVLLDAPAEVLQNRKQEVPLSETVRQREMYLGLAREFPEIQTVDASRTPAEVSFAIMKSVLHSSAGRLARRGPAVR